MQWSQGSLGRVFVLRLEQGERVPAVIEDFAREQGIDQALCALLGGIGGGRLVVGPADGEARPVEPLFHPIQAVQEAAALGTLFPDSQGVPRLHMHAALGRGGGATVGCLRPGVEVWQVAEVVILELKGLAMSRRLDADTGFELLSAD